MLLAPRYSRDHTDEEKAVAVKKAQLISATAPASTTLRSRLPLLFFHLFRAAFRQTTLVTLGCERESRVLIHMSGEEGVGAQIHVPKTRGGGAFTDSKNVKLHANDFEWETKLSELSENERSLVAEYMQKCMDALRSGDRALDSSPIPPKPWESHFSSSKHHFPIKNYIVHAFPLLRSIVAREDAPAWVLECGCGTGSTLLPIMRECGNASTHFVGFDISPSAIAHFGAHEIAQRYAAQDRLTLFPLAIGASSAESDAEVESPVRKRQRADGSIDLVAQALQQHAPPLTNQKFDAILLVFVLSALPTVEKMLLAVKQLRCVLKPDGVLLFRDYALADHNFFRFLSKTDNKVCDVAFPKGDTTTQVFFHKEFAAALFAAAGLVEVDSGDSKLMYHCNRIVNRKNGKRMDKIFVNGSFKLATET